MQSTKWKQAAQIAGLVAVVVLLKAGQADAWELGITSLDGFMQTLETGLPRCGLLFALVGAAGLLLSKMESHFDTFLSGHLKFFTNAAIYGSIGTILSTLGLQG